MESTPSPTVAAWFSNLPLSDSRCDNDSCTAFETAHSASQAQISWASQFLYGHYVAWFYAVILALFAVVFFFHQARDRLHWSRSKPVQWRSKGIALIRSFAYRRFGGNKVEYFSVPSYGVLFLILFFFFAAALMVFTQHPYLRPRSGYGSPPLSVRAGIMAFALFPLEIALAGKFNLITLITGIGHEKLNFFHRAVGFIMLFLALVHSIPFLYQPYHEGGMAQLYKVYYQDPSGELSMEFTGTPTLAMLVGLALLSLPPIRRHMYELFVNLHIFLAIVFFGLSFWHAGQELDSWNYLWATLAIWLTSYLGRFFAKSSAFPISRQWFTGCPTAIYKLPNNMLKMEVYVHHPMWRWEPGQHVYLRFLGINGFDNHPFTIANCSEPAGESAEGKILKFLVRPRKGFTARLSTMGDSNTLPGIEGRISSVVEGPYGTIIRPRVENRYETAILVGGGGGISGVLPWLEHLSMSMSSKDSTCVTQRVFLIWVVRRASSLQWMEQEIREAKARDRTKAITIHIWVTADQEPDDQRISLEKFKGDRQPHVGVLEDGSQPESSTGWIDQITFQERPRMMEIIPGMLDSNRTIVIGCGPECLKVDLSNTVAKAQHRVLEGHAAEVKLHTDTFGW